MTVRIIHADMLEALPQLLADGVRFDSVVCDPPYHLTSIVKRFGGDNAAPAMVGATGAYARASAGFMGKQWDGGDIAFRPETWAAVMAVLKPGGHLIAFSGSRTYHRMACAIEDAGFEIRDQLMWLYGSGFPKSHDISKGIDKAAGARGNDSTGFNTAGKTQGARSNGGDVFRSDHPDYVRPSAITDEARKWQGWGTALKPAHEPIVLARKPFRGTVAANVAAHGVGGINVDGCRIGTDEDRRRPSGGGDNGLSGSDTFKIRARTVEEQPLTLGRWPANVLHDGSDEVVAAFPRNAGGGFGVQGGKVTGEIYSREGRSDVGKIVGHGDSVSAARFFYSAKADATDRCGSKHPTVKPTDLMAYLVRLVTPAGGLVLDPFAGSGSTGMACLREGFDAVLIEREAEYVADIQRRIAHVSGEDSPLFAGVAI